MKLSKVKLFFLGFFLISSVYANEGNQKSTDNLTDADTKVLLELQKQIQELQGEINSYKETDPRANFGIPPATSNTEGFVTYSSKVGPEEDIGIDKILKGAPDGSVIDDAANEDFFQYTISSSIINSKGGIDVSEAAPITTQGQVSYLGSFSGNNSIPIGQISSNLFASTLLGQRGKFDDYSVFFGGFIEADAQVWFGSQIPTRKNNRSANGQNIYLNSAKLFFLSNLGHYVTAQFDFDADGADNFNVGNAFVIFGNLDTSPWFVTAGRNKLSVGSFGGGGPLTAGITKNLFSPGNVTNVSLNYKNERHNFNIAVFGAENTNTSSTDADFSLAYFYAAPVNEYLALGFNAGYIFNGRGAGTRNFDNITDTARVGVVNSDINLALSNILPGLFQVGAGWAQTTNTSSQYNGISNTYAGAWTIQANYAQKLAGRNTNFNVSYGQTYNANNIPMKLSSPVIGDNVTNGIGMSNQLIFSAQRAYFDNNVLFGPEYSYQKLYNGQSTNTITLDMAVYV
ncbi:DUF3573 domain-containing protein [Francisella frigiditurris]|uniref:DUF3573 domain-containing protein n=1 Tax=Francisella frigiditurris TaxID=1542390 RepID=A0A1J0KV73_9GAMM|nr:DUF3573 domain-containing protein [Francisella frigiditurris]APC97578.1 hypothetical protein KX01_1539 [Francisella frigiditurris]